MLYVHDINTNAYVAASRETVIAEAKRALTMRRGTDLTSPRKAQDALVMRLAERKAECFGVLLLDSRQHLIELRELFQGTIDGASVYPREVVRVVLESNAHSVILFHNHPSGSLEPSLADERITTVLRDALALIDCRVLDHLIVAGSECTSFAARGLM